MKVLMEGAGGWSGGSQGATKQGVNEALNGVLNEVLNGGWWRLKKCCPEVPISYVFRGGKNGQKWGWVDSWVDKWVDFLCKHRPL